MQLAGIHYFRTEWNQYDSVGFYFQTWPLICLNLITSKSELKYQKLEQHHSVFPNGKWCHPLLVSEPEKNTKTIRRRQINWILLALDTAYENRATNDRPRKIKKGPFCKSEKEIKSISIIHTLDMRWNFAS